MTQLPIAGRPVQDTVVPRRRVIVGVPGVQALLMQALSLVLVLATAYGVDRIAGVQITLAFAALLQGALAAVFAWRRKLAPWWLPIQFFFPLAVLLFQSLHLPPWLFLAAFLLLTGLFWTTFRTQVPFYPSNSAVWSAIAARLLQPARFIDIGSGFGGLVLRLAAQRPESRFHGIELAPLPWVASMLRARLAGSAARFIRGDYDRLDFSQYDVVFAFLSPAAMPALWRKASREMQTGALLLSYEFPIPGVTPHIVDHPVEGGPALYGWYF